MNEQKTECGKRSTNVFTVCSHKLLDKIFVVYSFRFFARS